MNYARLTDSQSRAISMIRVISIIFIVSCHILQGINNVFAWWLNVGVQIFLFMSGFLMANSKIESTGKFLSKKLKRILVPYYIFLIVMIFIYNLNGIITTKKSILVYFLGLQGFKYKYQFILPGIEHLWFISIILVCYLISLVLDKFRLDIDKYTEYKFYNNMILIFIFIQIFILFSMDYEVSFGAWICVFILGYLISYRYKFNIPIKFVISIGIISAITIPIRIFYQYINPIENEALSWIFNQLYIPWTHMILGTLIFSILYIIFMKIYENRNINKYIKLVDNYSYEIYITHQIFILGPFSLLYLTDKMIINIPLIIILILLSSLILNKVSNIVYKYLK